MSIHITAEPPTPGVATGVPQGEPNSHFDSLEARFFDQGQDGAIPLPDDDYFDDNARSVVRQWFALSRQFFTGLAVGGALVAVLGGPILWRSSRQTPTDTPASATLKQSMFPPAQTALANAASATPIQPTAQAERVQEAILPDSQGPQILATSPLTAGDIGPVVAPPAVAALPVPPATPTPFPIPANAVPAVNQAGLANTPASDNAEPPVAAAPPSPGDSVQRSCRKAIDDRQNKTILSTCAEAFTANPSAADIAVLLAKIEFDRGRVAQAFEWSKKAIAVNPNLADAYVFIGEAEQNAGHSKAAKDAYLRYLRLAPGGRYASDLRAVIHSL